MAVPERREMSALSDFCARGGEPRLDVEKKTRNHGCCRDATSTTPTRILVSRIQPFCILLLLFILQMRETVLSFQPAAFGVDSTRISRTKTSRTTGRLHESRKNARVLDVKSKHNPPQDDTWNWNASGSFGSLLMQLQKKEEAMIAKNESLLVLEGVSDLGLGILESAENLEERAMPKQELDDDEEEDGLRAKKKITPPLSAAPPTKKRVSSKQASASASMTTSLKQSEFVSMNWETAKELDDAVISLDASKDLVADIKVLPLDPLYYQYQQQAQDATSSASTTTSTKADLPLSRPEHYRDRIGQNMRHLAVSIASSIESVQQWRLFCQEAGGLYPLLTTLRQGAESIAQKQEVTLQQKPLIQQEEATDWLGRGDQKLEESFLASCNACRALRDVCALSPQVAAVITDGILRANQAWDGGLLNDFATFLKYANEYTLSDEQQQSSSEKNQRPANVNNFRRRWRKRRDARLRCQLYVNQLLLDMTFASDDAVAAIRKTPGLADAILACSSYARKEQTRRWLRYPGELAKYFWRRLSKRKNRKTMDGGGDDEQLRRPFIEAASVANDLNGQVQKTSNKVLAAIGYNRWIPKIPGQKGLRILCIDGGGSRGMTAVTAVNSLMQYVGDGMQVADSFDLIAGTSTGGIIAFLTGLKHETTLQAMERYNVLIKQIFVKNALSTPRMVFTTATYDEVNFLDILSGILGDDSMLDSRSDPSTPYVCCLTSKMSSTPTHVALFRNYNYGSGELKDHFTLDPSEARAEIDLPLELEHELIQSGHYNRKEKLKGASPGAKISDGSRHPGSFRVLQRYALRASTAAPTVFKPVMMAGEMYCDGGIVASNPTAVAIHEARTLFPDVRIEMVVSVGTGGFLEQKSSPRFGWDAIIGQIVGSACDGEQIHHILEDILGDPDVLGRGSSVSKTAYYRFNPVIGLPDEFPIDVTDPEKLRRLKSITQDYMNEPAQQAKMKAISDSLKGRPKWRNWFSR